MSTRAIFMCCQNAFNGESNSHKLYSFWKLTDVVVACASCYHGKTESFLAFPLDLSVLKTEQEKYMLHHSTDPVKKHFISQKNLKVKTNSNSISVVYECERI